MARVDPRERHAGERAHHLVLLDADPLSDITNARKIAAVIRDGRWLSRQDLDDKLADLARRYLRDL